MGVLADLGRSATIAWSPSDPILAAGTAAESTDALSDGAPRLELFKLDQATGKVNRITCAPTSEKFNRLAWSPAGLLAGGLTDGTVRIWDAPALVRDCDVSEGPGSAAEALNVVYGGPSVRKRHTAPVRGLDFNPVTNTLLASGAADSELLIWDLASEEGPKVHSPGAAADRAAQQPTGTKPAEITALAWNRKVKTILSSTNSNALTVVWDLRQKKKVASIADPRGRLRSSALAWHPSIATQLVVAVDDAVSDAMLLWDLRKASTPIKKYSHHEGGIISLAWNEHDDDMILTTGKDSRTCIVSAKTGEVLSEMAKSSAWNFDVQWSPRVPGIFSTSSLEGRLGVHSLLSPSTPGAPNFSTTSALADSFNIDETEFIATSPQLSSGNVQDMTRPPQWLRRPVGCAFGFGGRICHFSKAAQGVVDVSSVVTEHEFLQGIESLERILISISPSELNTYCDMLAEKDPNPFAWEVLRTQFEEDARRKLIKLLGFSPPNNSTMGPDTVVGLKLGQPLAQRFTLRPEITREQSLEVAGAAGPASPTANHAQEEISGPAPWETEDDSEEPVANAWSTSNAVEEAAAGNADQPARQDREERSVDNIIKRSILVGDFEAAVAAAIEAGRNADALMLAHCGGPNLWLQTQERMLAEHSVECMRSLFRVVVSPQENSWKDTGTSQTMFTNEQAWKEALSVIAAYDAGEDFVGNCNNVGARLLVEENLSAALCFSFCAFNVGTACQIWMKQQTLGAGNAPSAAVRNYRLEELISLTRKVRTLLTAAAMSAGVVDISAITADDEVTASLFLEVAALLAAEGELESALKYAGSLASDVRGPYGTAGDLTERVKICLLYAPKASGSNVTTIQQQNRPANSFQPTSVTSMQGTTLTSPPGTSYGGGLSDQPAMPPAPYGQKTYPNANPSPPVYTTFTPQVTGMSGPSVGPPPPPPTRQDLQSMATAPSASNSNLAHPPIAQASPQNFSHPTASQISHAPVPTTQPGYAPASVGSVPPPQPPGQPTRPNLNPQQTPVHDFGDNQFFTPTPASVTSSAPPVFNTAQSPALPTPVGATQPPPQASFTAPPTQVNHPPINIAPVQPVLSASANSLSAARTTPQPAAPPTTGTTRSAGGVAPPPTSQGSGPPPGAPPRRVPDSAEVAGVVKMKTAALTKEPVVTLAEADVTNVPAVQQSIPKALREGFSQVSGMNQSPVFKRKMDDVSKRLGRVLYRLNAGSLDDNVITKLSDISSAIIDGNWDAVSSIVARLLKENWEGNNEWILGLKRLAESGKTGR